MNYTKDELKDLSDTQLLSLLKKNWGINEDSPIETMGRVEVFFSGLNNFYLLKNATINNKTIEYPNKVLVSAQYSIQQHGIYIKTINLQNQALISCKLELSPKYEREKHNNPFELNVIPSSIELLKVLDNKEFFIETFKYKNSTYTKISILAYFKKTFSLELEQQNKEIAKHIEKINTVKNKHDKIIAKYEKETEIKIYNLQNQYKIEEDNHQKKLLKFDKEINSININLQNQFKIEEDKHNKALNKLEKIEKKKTKIIEQLKESQQLIIKDIKEKKDISKTLDEEIEKLEQILKDKEDIMGKKLEKLRSYIKEKADVLLKLEFIDEKEYNDLLMINHRKNSNEKFVNFKDDLQADKQKAISHIQAYLKEQDIFYPRYILEDFFALIQTNDLIVLAGESGSGKTNLVKSFAEAIGGECKIIPVKPNWTSSEDLLGYYNPLEKKYLTTPFLEALLEAKNNPDIPYFICLDEMNLARVEYYFADFLSLLEERNEQPEIKLYSEDESAHILSEFKNVINTIKYVKEKYQKNNIVDFIQLLQDKEINQELTRIFGFSDKDSLIKYHTDLRRMISGILNTPSSIIFPKNVRIIGAINIDETTHYLSPKILDRAHIMKFDSPLLQDWDKIEEEIDKDIVNKELKIKFDIDDLGSRESYPKFDRDDEFCKIVTDMTKKYFNPLGIEVGLRTIRQGLNYQRIFSEQDSDVKLVMNNFILHKILPKMTFDGSKQVGDETRKDLLTRMKENLKDYINQDLAKSYGINAISEIEGIIKTSENNEGIVNYWA